MRKEALTFAMLERCAGQSYSPNQGEKWPLEEWYDAVREIPITQLSAGDLAKACRQNVWIEEVMPRVAEVLTNDPHSGELYDGELVVALKRIPRTYWVEHPAVANTIKQSIEQNLAEFDEDVQDDAKELLSRLC